MHANESKAYSVLLPYALLFAGLLLSLYLVSLPAPQSGVASQSGSLTVFEDPNLALPLIAFLAVLLILMWKFGNMRTVAIGVVLLFTFYFLGFWVVKAPGNFYGADTTTAYSTYATGHVPTIIEQGAFPGEFIIAAVVGVIIGPSFSGGLILLGFFKPFLVALLSYIIAEKILGSNLLASSAAILSVIADEQIAKVPPFEWGTYSALFFLLMVLALMRLRLVTRGNMILFFLSFTAATITYPLVPFTGILILGLLLLSTRLRGGSTSGPGIGRVLSASMALFLLWDVLVTFPFGVGVAVLQNLLNLIAPSQLTGQAAVGTQTHAFYLFQLLGSTASSLPYNLGYFLPAWFLFLFGGGLLAWAFSWLRKYPIHVKAAFVVPATLDAALLYFLPGGAEWVRALPFLAPFLASVMVYIFARKHPRIALTLLGIALLTSAPTIISYFPNIPSEGSPYSTAAGSFLSANWIHQTIWMGDGLWTLSSVVQNKIMSSVPTGAVSQAEALSTFVSPLKSFATSHSSLLSISPGIYRVYSHTFGLQESDLELIEQSTLSRSDLVYSNGYTQIYSS